MHSLPFVKVCCISSVREAQLAIACGASALGLVSHMPSGPGVIDEALIAEILQTVPSHIATFLLTSEQSADLIVAQHRRCPTTAIQLCEQILPEVHSKLRRALPEVQLVQVIHVRDERSVEEARNASEHVDAILLDSGNLDLIIKELGGTGRVHDWSISRTICETVNVPVFLAGGLNANNIRAAILEVGPYGVDLCSGVRTDKHLDETKLKAFFKELKIG